jgi:toxin-antitoxin system PIN domain toxin
VRALLDINFIIALLDSGHTFHNKAHEWWVANKQSGWASCAISENGVVRIMSNPSYGNQARLSPTDVTDALKTFVSQTDHEFWKESISLRDDEIFDTQRILSSRLLTDLYFLALATKHGGKLVTFDRNIPLTAVQIAKPANLSVL